MRFAREDLRPGRECYYSEHMATMRLKVARIGNSRGVRLPAASLRRYRIGDSVVMELDGLGSVAAKFD